MGCMFSKHSDEPKGDDLVDLRDFKVLRAVGEGSFCKVRIVQRKNTGELYAMKYIPKKKCTSNKMADNILRERNFLETLSPHPFVVNLRFAFQDDINLYMIVDLMLGGDLRYYLNNIYKKNERKTRNSNENFHSIHHRIKISQIRISETVLRFFMAQCCISIHYLHGKGIIHRDIKPENLLIDSFGYLHLSDLNVATNIPPKGKLLRSRTGTLSYMAPEVIRKAGYGEGVDWWSLGVVMYECMFGRRPFAGDSRREIMKSIIHGQYLVLVGKYSPECLLFLKGLLKMNPKKRLGYMDMEDHVNGSFQAIKEHPFFGKIEWNMLEKKLLPSPYRPSPSKFHFDAVHEINCAMDDDKIRFRKKNGSLSSSLICRKLETEFEDYKTSTISSTKIDGIKQNVGIHDDSIIICKDEEEVELEEDHELEELDLEDGEESADLKGSSVPTIDEHYGRSLQRQNCKSDIISGWTELRTSLNGYYYSTDEDGRMNNRNTVARAKSLTIAMYNSREDDDK